MEQISFIEHINSYISVSGEVVTGLLLITLSLKFHRSRKPFAQYDLPVYVSNGFIYFLFIFGCFYLLSPLHLLTIPPYIFPAIHASSIIIGLLLILLLLNNKDQTAKLNKVPKNIEDEINARLNIEDTLIAKNNQLEWAEKTAKICYANWDVINDSVKFSDGAEDILGVNANDEFTFDQLKAMIIPEDRILIQRIIETIVNENIFNSFIFRIIVSNKLKYIQVKGEIIIKQGEKAHLLRGTFQDVTEQQMFVKRIEDKNLTLKDIAQTQSHDVRGPLATIVGLTSLLEEDDFNTKQAKEVIAGIKESTAQLDDIIRKIVKRAESIDVDLS